MAVNLNGERIRYESEPRVSLSAVADSIRKLNESEQEFGAVRVTAQNGNSIRVTCEALGNDVRLSVTGSNAIIQRGELRSEQEEKTYQKFLDKVSSAVKDQIHEKQMEEAQARSGVQLGGIRSSTLVWAALNELNAKRDENGEFDIADTLKPSALYASFTDEFGKEYATFSAGVHNAEGSTLDRPITEPYMRIEFGEAYGGQSYDVPAAELTKALDLAKEGKWYASDVNKFVTAQFSRSAPAEAAIGAGTTRNNLSVNVMEGGKDINTKALSLNYDIEMGGTMIADSARKELYRADDGVLDALSDLRNTITSAKEGPAQESVEIASSITQAIGEPERHFKAEKEKGGVAVTIPSGFLYGFRLGNEMVKLEKEWDKALAGSEEYKGDKSQLQMVEARMHLNDLTREFVKLKKDLNIYAKAGLAIREGLSSIGRRIDGLITQIRTQETHVKAEQSQEQKQTVYNAFISSKFMDREKAEINNDLSKVVNEWQNLCNAGNRLAQNPLVQEMTDGAVSVSDMITNNAWRLKDEIRDVILDAQVSVEAQSYLTDRVAEMINDTAVNHMFQNISSNEFAPNLNSAICWKELNSMYNTYEDAQGKDSGTLSARENAIVMRGPGIVKQKQQMEQAATAVCGELAKMIDDKSLTREEAVDRLSKAVTENLKDNDSPASSHNGLTDISSSLVNEIAEKILDNFPAVNEGLETERESARENAHGNRRASREEGQEK